MKRLLVLAVLVPLFFPAYARAQDDEDKDENGKSKFEKLIEDATMREGFFDTYQKDGHLYLAVPEERLGEEFIMSFQIAQGIGGRFLYGGTMLSIFEPKLVAFEEHEGKIFLVQLPHRYRAKAETPQAEAVDLTFGASVLETGKVAARRDADSAFVVDVYGWLVSDLSAVGNRVNFAVATQPGQPGNASFDKSRSFLEEVKAFPENLSMWAKLTFKPSRPTFLRTVPDSRYIPLKVHYTFAAAPSDPMEPRYGDDRTGYFMTVHKDFTEGDKTFFKRYVNKWRLECADQPGPDGLCTPKEQIVYYIDHTVPVEHRQAMMDGVEAFDAAFEAAGFRDAVRAEMLPEDADAEDIRYATLRWNTSDIPGYGAIGPSIVDPRTGEILDADILFEANMVLGWKNFYRANVSPRAAVEELVGATEGELSRMAQGGEMATFADEISAQGTLLRTALLARGELAPGEPVPDSYVYEAMLRVTMHEVGHTLGLRHNFRSSVDTPFERLHDRGYAEENGLYSSVMEYPGINIAPEGQTQGYYYTPVVGTYDQWVIAYGYTPDADRAEELARQGAMPGNAYGTDEDARGAGALDPTVNIYDLGDDPLAWGKQRAELIRGIWSELPQHVLTDNTAYYQVTDAFQTLMVQYARAVATGLKYIGGQYQYRDHVGDPRDRGPFMLVPKARQQEALDFIVSGAFAEDAFDIQPEVLQQLGADRWSHWGNSTTFNGRIDYPLHEQVAGLQQALMNRLTNPFLLNRIRDAEMKFGKDAVLGVPALMSSLTEAVWAEAWTRPGRDVPATRRDLQRAHLDRMIQLVIDPPARTPADAQAVARMQLEDVLARINQRLTPPFNFNDYTLAHFQESAARIEQALEAGLSLEN